MMEGYVFFLYVLIVLKGRDLLLLLLLLLV